MEVIHFTEDHKEFRHRLKSFINKEVLPNIEQWEADGIVPRSVWKKMGQEGFLCTSLPEKYGGIGGDFVYSLIGAEEMARTNHYGLMSFLHNDIVVPYISAYGSEEIKDKYLPGCVSGDIIAAVAMTEPNAGSDLVSMEATAVDDGDSVIIDGAKIFISNGINCGVVVLAVKDPEEENPHKAVSLYVVEEGTPGFEKGQNLEKMGFHSQDTAELFFTKCRVPKSNMLGKKGEGFYLLMNKLQQERLICSVASFACGEYAFDTTLEYCKNKKLGQADQFKLAEMATDLKMGKTFLYSLVVDHVAHKNINIETSMMKYWASEMAHKILDGCLDIYGLDASLESCPIERAWRDVKVMEIFAGTNQIMRQIIAKSMGL